MNIPLMTAAALTLALPAAPALADDAIQTENFRVEYRDLDLGTREGQKRLDRRIQQAARMVCGIGDQQTGSRVDSTDSRECYRRALTQARQSVAETVDSHTSQGG